MAYLFYYDLYLQIQVWLLTYYRLSDHTSFEKTTAAYLATNFGVRKTTAAYLATNYKKV